MFNFLPKRLSKASTACEKSFKVKDQKENELKREVDRVNELYTKEKHNWLEQNIKQTDEIIRLRAQLHEVLENVAVLELDATRSFVAAGKCLQVLRGVRAAGTDGRKARGGREFESLRNFPQRKPAVQGKVGEAASKAEGVQYEVPGREAQIWRSQCFVSM